jgi:hypothetical protein
MKPGTAKTVPFTGHTGDAAQMNPGHDNPNKVRPTGPVDPAVTVLSVQTRDGRPLALLANYSTHYAGAPGVSADYFGAFDVEMAKRLGEGDPSFVAIMSNGTSGDVNCIDFSKPRRSFDRFDVANAVADAAEKAIADVEYSASVPIVMLERRMELGVRVPTPEEAAEAKAWLAENLGDRPVRTWEEDYARETVLLSKGPDRREIKLQAIRIGDFVIAALPTETYARTGLAIKDHSPLDTTMVIGLANGFGGYLPPPDQHELGGYTTWRARSSCLEVEAEPKIVETLVDLLEQTAEAPKSVALK